MAYLETTVYESYGLAPDTTDDWIAVASGMIDGYCRRASVLATQYVERLRVVEGSQTVRLSYLPLIAVSPATIPLVTCGEDTRGRAAAKWDRSDWTRSHMRFRCRVRGHRSIRHRLISCPIPAS